MTLPPGASTNQIIKVQARGFTGVVPLTVVVTPDAAPSTSYDLTIDVGIGNVARTNLTVLIPVDTKCQIHAWTR